MTDRVKPPSNTLLFAADMAGTLLFAIEGALAAISGDLDLLGLMVLAFSVALGGGIFRDLLIGAIPPSSLRDWRYSAMAFAGGAVVFFMYRFVQGIPSEVILILDAAGLALFAVAGTEKALLYGMHPFIAVLLGTVTAVGGGTVRDIFLARVPLVLRSDIYATAAMAGAVVMIVSRRLKMPHLWSAVLGGMFCFVLRIVSVWRHWNLPKVLG
ncbi:MAG: trimeric intracellular cation channel family protein [Terriglobales bacterium]